MDQRDKIIEAKEKKIAELEREIKELKVDKGELSGQITTTSSFRETLWFIIIVAMVMAPLAISIYASLTYKHNSLLEEECKWLCDISICMSFIVVILFLLIKLASGHMSWLFIFVSLIILTICVVVRFNTFPLFELDFSFREFT